MKNCFSPSFLSMCLVFLFFVATANAQQSSFSKGRVFLTNGQKIEFSSFTLGEESHSYNTSSTGSSTALPANQVVKIEEQNGTEAAKWALWFGLSGLIGSTLGVLQAKNDASNAGVEDFNGTPIIVGLTALSTGIGALIGASKKKYRTVYTNPSLKTSMFNKIPDVSLLVNGKGASIQLAYSF